MAASSIEWTDVTDNVFVVEGEDGEPDGWYCRKVSPGCQHCYAERINGTSFYGGNGMKYRLLADGDPRMMMRRGVMAKWAKMRKPKKHFVNSMTDTFADFYPSEWIYELFDAMVAAPLQTFQVLTKRTERMFDVVIEWLRLRNLPYVPTNIWLGFSAESQEWYDKRAFWMLNIPALVFVSLEPLLGPIDLNPVVSIREIGGIDRYEHEYSGFMSGIDWVIVGGESGSHARPMHPDWVISIQEQCAKSGTPFFFKQWGEWGFVEKGVPIIKSNLIELDGDRFVRFGKKTMGRRLYGKEWNQFPEVHYAD